MQQKQRIETSGQLRQFLCDSIIAVKNGDMKPDVAARVVKMATVVNESIYCEVKAWRFLKEIGEEVNGMGDFRIGPRG